MRLDVLFQPVSLGCFRVMDQMSAWHFACIRSRREVRHSTHALFLAHVLFTLGCSFECVVIQPYMPRVVLPVFREQIATPRLQFAFTRAAKQ
jgi:hypothetical protein